MRTTFCGALAALLLGATSIAHADVKAGVDAWNQGDYPRAVNEWRPLAIGGSADAQFNLGQAYKLGRGVPVDLPVALEWFRKAAEQGHEKASDNYGLLLFQQGRREEALPYLKASSERGEPRAQYVYATSLFNGDIVERDWVRAYALMTRAAEAGVQQATTSLAQMEQFIPEEDRMRGRAMAATLAGGASPAAHAEAPVQVAQAAQPTQAAPKPAPVKPAIVKPAPAPAVKAPSPAPVATPAQPIEVAETPAPRPAVSKPVTAPAPVAASNGRYRVQLGAFRENGRAEALWKSLRGKIGDLSAYTPTFLPTNGLTRLLVGPLGSSADAQRLCGRITPTGTPCIVQKM